MSINISHPGGTLELPIVNIDKNCVVKTLNAIDSEKISPTQMVKIVNSCRNQKLQQSRERFSEHYGYEDMQKYKKYHESQEGSTFSNILYIVLVAILLYIVYVTFYKNKVTQ
jgi:hypothetical protein